MQKVQVANMATSSVRGGLVGISPDTSAMNEIYRQERRTPANDEKCSLLAGKGSHPQVFKSGHTGISMRKELNYLKYFEYQNILGGIFTSNAPLASRRAVEKRTKQAAKVFQTIFTGV